MEAPHPDQERTDVMTAPYGFHATLTALPGEGDRLTGLLLTGLDAGSPGSSPHCLVYLVSRSASDPDTVHVVEGWTSAGDHRRAVTAATARVLMAGVTELLAREPEYTDLVPVRGRTAF
jgi:quinol monooxygenase YgiN